MKKTHIVFGTTLALFIFAAVLAATPLTALARDGERSGEGGGTRSSEQRSGETRTDDTTAETEVETQESPESESESTSTDSGSEVKREDRKEVARERLDDAKKKACTQREANINAAMDRIVERSQKHVDRISAVSEKAKQFYIAQGNVLSTYDELVAVVEQKKIAAQAAVDALSEGAVFSCDSDGPRSDLQDFRNGRLNKIEAVGAYRTAVKELIAGIKSVQPDDTSTEAQS